MNSEHKVGDYRLATDGKSFIVQRFTDGTIWPSMIGKPPEWRQISSPDTREAAKSTMDYFRRKDTGTLWRPA